MNFTATLQLGGKTATGIRVPDEIMIALGGGKRIAVTVTINGYSYPSTIATMLGEPMIPVSAEVRAATGVSAGDQISIGVEVDTEPRTVDVPPDLAKRFKLNPAAASQFAKLSYSNQRRHVLSITGARGVETRIRRVQRVMTELDEATG